MRTFAAVVTTAALAFGGFAPAEAASKPRIGGPCKKIHQVDWIKNVRAQCTWVPVKGAKKGRLIWKALPLPKLTATKQELTPPSAPSIPATFDELMANVSGISYGAWKRSAEAMAAAQARDIPVEVKVGPTTTVSTVDTEAAISLITRLFPATPLPKRMFIVVHNNADRDWAKATVQTETGDGYRQILNSEGGDITASNCRPDASCPGAKQMMVGGSGVSVLMFGDNGLKQPNATDRIGRIVHEMVHSLQAAQTGERKWGAVPRWLVEGGAEWANITATSTSHSEYLSLRKPRSEDLVRNRDTYNAAWVETFLRTMDWNADYENWRWYDVGLRATEVLTVIGGPDSWMRIFAEVGSGKDFPTAFETIYGASWDATAPKIAAAVAAGI